MSDTIQGQVAFLNDEKGFGFLKVEGYDKDVFFHAKDIRHTTFERIRKGDMVSIGSIKKSEKGYNAMDVFLIS